MRITVDIDEATLSEAMQLTGEQHKSPAVSKAVGEFVRRSKAREFGRLIREGAFDYPEQPEGGFCESTSTVGMIGRGIGR